MGIASMNHVKSLIKQHWGDRAREFDAAPNHAIHSPTQHQAWLEVLARLAGDRPLRILDVGCGTGFLTLLLAELGHDVLGIDLSPEMVNQARRKAEERGLRAKFFEGDAELLYLPNGKFDLVVARHLIWTLPDPEKAVREWLSVLKPGGRFALFEGDWGGRSDIKGEYRQIHEQLPFYGGQPSHRLADFLTGLGLREIQIEPLMSETLWGEMPQHERYLMIARRVA